MNKSSGILVVAACSALAACEAPVTPGERSETGLSLVVQGSFGQVDQWRAHVEGPTDRVVTGAPGERVTISGLAPGSYTVALEGFAGSIVEQYFETSVQVVAGRNTTVSVAPTSFQPSISSISSAAPLQFSVSFSGITGAGSYRVEWDDNATFSSPGSQSTSATNTTITVAEAAQFHVRVRAVSRFESMGTWSVTRTVDVLPLTGSLRVTASTTGDTLDFNGYTVVVDDVSTQVVSTNGFVTIPDLMPGNHTVEIGDVAVNCSVTGANPQTVSVSSGGETATTFNVTCKAALFNQIAFGSTRDFDEKIFFKNADGTGSARVLIAPCAMSFVDEPAWSLDGTEIAVTSNCEQGLDFDIIVYKVDRTDSTKIGRADFIDRMPAWSPDGTRIAFNCERGSTEAICVANRDGSGLTFLTGQNFDWNPTWAPDGTQIAYESGRNEGAQDTIPGIYVINVDGTGERRLTNGQSAFDPAWSPDGTEIAFTSRRDGHREVYVMSAGGGSERRLTDHPAGNYHPAWSPDGIYIAFTSERDGNTEIYFKNADGTGGVTRVTNHPQADYWPTWSPRR